MEEFVEMLADTIHNDEDYKNQSEKTTFADYFQISMSTPSPTWQDVQTPVPKQFSEKFIKEDTGYISKEICNNVLMERPLLSSSINTIKSTSKKVNSKINEISQK